MRLAIPTVSIFTETHNIDRLAQVVAPAWAFPGPFILDFSQCEFLAADGAVILAGLKLRRDYCRFITVLDWQTIQPALLHQLERWELASLFGGFRSPWPGNAIPLCHQPTADKVGVVSQ